MALARLIDEKFGLKTRAVENPITQAVAIIATTILNNNPDRLGFLVVNLGANPVYLGLTPNVTATNGIYLAAGGGLVSMFYGEEFALVGWQFWAIAVGGISTVYVLEVEAE